MGHLKTDRVLQLLGQSGLFRGGNEAKIAAQGEPKELAIAIPKICPGEKIGADHLQAIAAGICRSRACAPATSWACLLHLVSAAGLGKGVRVASLAPQEKCHYHYW